MMRWIVGDVHGCARELDALLGEIRHDPARDELWCVGDFVNRGPDSAAAVRLLRDAGARGVLGNHDLYVLRWRAGLAPRKADNLGPFFAAPDADESLAWMASCPGLVHVPETDGVRGLWIVHAGLDPRWADLHGVARRLAGPASGDRLLDPDLAFATNVRCCTADGERSSHTGCPEDCPGPFAPWDSFYRGDTLVVHGHWATRGLYRGERTLGLDSGCVHGGKLSAWCHEEDRIVQVPRRS
jgi:bis(5'-nucleosyl)-tetraphosphatase (symmetrical)